MSDLILKNCGMKYLQYFWTIIEFRSNYLLVVLNGKG